MRCRSCDAVLDYTPGQSDLVCRYCGARQAIADEPAPPKDDYRAIVREQVAAADRAETETVACGTCGAETTLAPRVLSARCPFCGSPEVKKGGARRLRPAAILPFSLDEKRAHAALAAWERALWLRPGRLLDAAALPLTPVYLPYWGFDWDVTTDYRGERGVKVDKTTRWEKVSGTVRTRLDSSLVFASRSLPRAALTDLEPFDTEHLVAFRDEHLLGVAAETAGEDVTTSADLSHRLLERQIRYDIERQIGGDEQRITEKATRYDAMRCQLHLLPIWIARYRHKGTERSVFVNGRTGEVIGSRPVSGWKLGAALASPLVLPVAGAAIMAAHTGGFAWRPTLLGFWGATLAQSILLMVARGGAPAGAPERHRQFYLTRPGSSGPDYNVAEVVGGVLQDDRRSRAAFFSLFGFAGLFTSLMPFFTTLMNAPTAMAIGAHVFSAIGVFAFAFATWISFRDKRRTLGLDEPRRGSGAETSKTNAR